MHVDIHVASTEGMAVIGDRPKVPAATARRQVMGSSHFRLSVISSAAVGQRSRKSVPKRRGISEMQFREPQARGRIKRNSVYKLRSLQASTFDAEFHEENLKQF